MVWELWNQENSPKKVAASFAFLYAKSYVKTIVILIQIFKKGPQNGTL